MKRTKIMSLLMVFIIAFAVLSAGCIDESKPKPKTSAQEAAFTESNQKRLTISNPAPSLDSSLERQNLIDRLNLLNNQNKIFYVYLVSYGKVMAEYTAKGKISSVNSKLTTQEQIIKSPFENGYEGRVNMGMVVESPALDGSYGTNGDAVFFFTTEGAYVEWNGEYFVSDAPLSLSTPPVLVRTLNVETKQVVEN